MTHFFKLEFFVCIVHRMLFFTELVVLIKLVKAGDTGGGGACPTPPHTSILFWVAKRKEGNKEKKKEFQSRNY